ncbi:MAG: hypothetical protein Pg6A_20320 [Termitinemataceae bacterium]|nr:MAG: hypothetical protein Pg6A_20320 [Termitinemataceae bacterium]
MKQGVQDTFKGIHYELYTYGCYFFDILRWAELDSEKEFNGNDILNFFSACKNAGLIGNECFVNNAAGIYNMAAGVNKYKDVRKIFLTSSEVAEKKMPASYIICNKKPMYTHFTLCHKGILWDSKFPDRLGALEYKPDSYRILI